jgi:hypothetical protein
MFLIALMYLMPKGAIGVLDFIAVRRLGRKRGDGRGTRVSHRVVI